MLRMDFTETEIEEMFYWKEHHPHPRVQKEKFRKNGLAANRVSTETIRHGGGYFTPNPCALPSLFLMYTLPSASFHQFLPIWSAGGVVRLKFGVST